MRPSTKLVIFGLYVLINIIFGWLTVSNLIATKKKMVPVVDAASTTDAPTPAAAASDSAGPIIELNIVNALTGEVSSMTLPNSKTALEDSLRTFLGMPSEIEEDKTLQHTKIEDLLNDRGCECIYVAFWNSPAYLDPQGTMWSGLSIDGGIFPVLERLPNGLIRTAMRLVDRTPEGMYSIIYLRAQDVTSNWRETDWAKSFGNYDVIPAVPELCGRPLKPGEL